jgi:hypothetical protein
MDPLAMENPLDPNLEVIAEQIYDILESEPIYGELEAEHIYELLNTGPAEEVLLSEFEPISTAYGTPIADQEDTGERFDIQMYDGESN